MSVITAILESRIKKFITEFNDTSRHIYADSPGKLRHAGEFGGYREKIVSQLLMPYIPKKYNIADGFLVNSNGEVSTQCDVTIFSGEKTCYVESDSHQKFFISQSVQCIGEVKSILTKKDLENSLKKLALIKELRLKSKKTDNLNYKNQPLTFLICEKMDFKVDNIKDVFENAYSNIPDIYKHNLILSIQDGLFTYYSKDEKTTIQYPIICNTIMHNLRIESEKKERNIQLLCSYIKQHLETCEDEEFEFLDHLSTDKDEKLKYLD